MERGEVMEFASLINEMAALSTAQGFVLWGALSTMFRSIILAAQGLTDQAFACAECYRSVKMSA
jgi:hypothetical protein